MKVFIYSADKSTPFSELYKVVTKEIIVSNVQGQHLDKFAKNRDRLMRLVSDDAVWFVPMAVKDTFLGWLEEKKYKPEKLPISTTPTCEILGNEEFNNWFNNSMKTQLEEYEMALQPNVQPPEELTTKLELLSKKITSIRRLAILSALIFAIVILAGGVFALMKENELEKQVNQLVDKKLSSIKVGMSEEQVKQLVSQQIKEELPQPKTIVFALVVGEDTVKGQGAKLFKELVEDNEIADKVKVEVKYRYKGSSEQAILTDLRDNTVQLAAPSLSQLDKYANDIQLFDVPYLFENLEAVSKFQEEVQGGRNLLKALKNELEREKLVGLDYWWHGGMKQLSANLRLISPTDVNDSLTFRVQPKSATVASVLESQFSIGLKAKVKAVPYNEVSKALENKIVNAQENTWSNSASEGYYKYQQYFHETNHGYLGYLLLTNEQFWNQQLSEKERQVLKKLLKQVTEEVNKRIVVDWNKKSSKTISEEVTIVKNIELNRDKWCQTMQQVWKGNRDFSRGEMSKYIEIAKRANRAVNKKPSLECFK